MYGSAGHGGAGVAPERRSRRRALGAASVVVGGVACAALLALAGVFRDRSSRSMALLEVSPWGYRQQSLFSMDDPRRLRATLQAMSEGYVQQWAAKEGPSDFTHLARLGAGMTEEGVPVCYPTFVKDLSGKLHQALPATQLRAIQHPLFNVVPVSHSQKLACRCESCEPQAGFPPVCTGCNCEEIVMHPDVWFLGHTTACVEGGCEDVPAGPASAGGGGGGGANGTNTTAAAAAPAPAAAGGGANATAAGGNATAGAEGGEIPNALSDWPECRTWACYNKKGWFCVCTCPGEGC
mmetsp:Transcript_35738/g.87913  ORF Transcript_35738/g.87913 Transcript_35738/m.87913 type:complete len:294 (-) Transcript_35738:325-1206(-)